MLRKIMVVGVVITGGASALRVPRSTGSPARRASVTMQEPPFPLPYEVPPMPKPFADYTWDDDFPGTLKPGKSRENEELDEVLAAWEGRDNPNCMELPIDQLWQVPLAPAEDILSWLDRIGLLSHEDDDEEQVRVAAETGLLQDEFDLEDSDIADGSLLGAQSPSDAGATMSDFL